MVPTCSTQFNPALCPTLTLFISVNDFSLANKCSSTVRAANKTLKFAGMKKGPNPKIRALSISEVSTSQTSR